MPASPWKIALYCSVLQEWDGICWDPFLDEHKHGAKWCQLSKPQCWNDSNLARHIEQGPKWVGYFNFIFRILEHPRTTCAVHCYVLLLLLLLFFFFFFKGHKSKIARVTRVAWQAAVSPKLEPREAENIHLGLRVRVSSNTLLHEHWSSWTSLQQ